MLIAKKIALAALGTMLLATPGHAGCKINLSVKNDENRSIKILNANNNDTSVRSNFGTWRDLRRGGWYSNSSLVTIGVGATKTDVYEAGFSCNSYRRFRIEYRCGSSNKSRVQYYPSATGWTRSQSLTVSLDGLNC